MKNIIYIYEMCIICRTYKVTYNHGKVHGETNLIDICILCKTLYTYIMMENIIYILEIYI